MSGYARLLPTINRPLGRRGLEGGDLVTHNIISPVISEFGWGLPVLFFGGTRRAPCVQPAPNENLDLNPYTPVDRKVPINHD